MSCPVKLQALPSSVFDKIVTPENMRVRSSVSSLSQLSFPKSRSALWDGTPAGEKLNLQLCSHRKLHLVLQEKTLRLAQRHARHSNKPSLHFFLLGSVSVDADEEGITVTLDRFDPGRDQGGGSGPVPSTVLPGDVAVPCLFSDRPEPMPEAVIHSETEFHQCFKVLQHAVSCRQTLDLSQLLKIRARIICSHQSDAAVFSLSWLAVCPAMSVDIQPVRPLPIIPTALLRSLTGAGRPAQHSSHQRGFLTMDQTRKLVLLLESDPKASSLPLVGLWMSGITHVYNPQVWVCSLRFMFGASLQDRVLSESGCFLLVVFGSTHRAPQFFQCRGSRTGPQLECQILTSTQSVTLYQQVVPADGRVLRCELGSEVHSRQAEVFRAAQRSFSSSPPPAAGLSVSDQDSGVEDEDLSPRPSPNPHLPAPQTRRVQPSVPELSLLVDGSFSFNQNKEPDPAPRPFPLESKTTAPATSSLASTSAPHLHSTPNSNIHQPCTCCSTHAYSCTSIHPSPTLPPAAPTPSHLQTSPKVSSAPSPSTPHQKPVCSRPVFQRPPAYQLTPPPMESNCPRPQSHQQTHPPPNHYSAVPQTSSHHHSPPPLHQPLPGPSLLSSNQKALHPSPCSPPPPAFTSQHVFPSHSIPAPPLPSSSCSNSVAPPSHTSPPSPCPAAPLSCLPPAPPCHCCPHPPLSNPALGADSLSPSWLPRPACVNRCCDLMSGVAPSDAYQLLLHQDRQLRLLQAQVQMLLEAQKKLQVNTQTSRSTTSVAVETGASLFWGSGPEQPPSHRDNPSSPPKLPTPSSSSSSSPTSSHDPCERRAVGGAENGDITSQEAPSSPLVQHSLSGLQSPVLGESVSMYAPRDEQQSFYKNLMTQLHSRLQESDDKQEVEEDSRRKSQPSSDHSHSSSSASSSSSQKKKLQLRERDPVVTATVRQLQQLGVEVDEADLIESDKNRLKAVQSASVLASINPAAVVSRLRVSEPTASALCPGGSVDLSLEANAIALRYLSDSQLSRLSLGGHTPQHIPTLSSNDSLLSPSNMSLATRKYMRRYGLIEEEGSEEEEEDNRVQKVSARRPLTAKLLPQSQVIRDLRPKMQLLTVSKQNADDKENFSGRRTALIRAENQQPEGSVGNILDLSRLRQLPKLF
ncbi:SCL-interrupting locus protein isoform X1 [Oryzias latipes]|uniref:SCL-interrupting locus protein isoform X1 n=1 Tax=Oryzias latipes TaxID=8090 RepID=UPI0002A4CBC6|nr:SCL-interrupting locus protein isoform X1 [Oryzias latipes]XP_020558246.1 SCL-interrupting locus protein isoform X1 [Oryzias latipes]